MHFMKTDTLRKLYCSNCKIEQGENVQSKPCCLVVVTREFKYVIFIFIHVTQLLLLRIVIDLQYILTVKSKYVMLSFL